MIRISLSLVMLFLLSCNDVDTLNVADNINPDSPLQIDASTVLSTKGELVYNPEDMGSVGLYCAMTGDEAWSSTTVFSKMADRRYYITEDDDWVIDGESEPWGYESYSDKYTFYAYSPYCKDTQGVTPSIVDGELIIKYIVPNSSIDQPDLMYAVPRKDIYAQVVGGTVSLNFVHTLSSVSFEVISISGDRITAIDITGAVSEGSLRWDYELEAPEWSLGDSTTASFSVEVDNYTLDDEEATQVNTERGYLMMIPQVLESGAKVTLTLDSGKVRTLSIPAGIEWEAGLKYNYTIQLDDDDCDFIFDSEQISNCYIINPTPDEVTIVQIPIEDRINDFWKNYAGSSNKIQAANTTDEYSVSTIWEDFDGTFSYSYRIIDDADEKMAVELTIPAEFQVGNFVFGVNEVDDNVRLWSWHLWFTDYNPDAIAKANSSNIEAGVDREYTLSGYEGAVHRYKDSLSSTVWSDIYSDKFIMDRNIGERNEYAANYGAGTVYYQYGRKDPFPGSGAWYSDTKSQPGARLSSSFSFKQSVWFSHDILISGTSSSNNWCGEEAARFAICIWYDENIVKSGYTEGKSIFDPSPLGWRVPVSDTWSSFDGTGSTQDGASKTKSVGIYNYYGCRNPEKDGALDQVDEVGYVWSATPVDYANGYCLYSSASSVIAPQSIVAPYCLPVRAIQE